MISEISSFLAFESLVEKTLEEVFGMSLGSATSFALGQVRSLLNQGKYEVKDIQRELLSLIHKSFLIAHSNILRRCLLKVSEETWVELGMSGYALAPGFSASDMEWLRKKLAQIKKSIRQEEDNHFASLSISEAIEVSENLLVSFRGQSIQNLENLLYHYLLGLEEKESPPEIYKEYMFSENAGLVKEMALSFVSELDGNATVKGFLDSQFILKGCKEENKIAVDLDEKTIHFSELTEGFRTIAAQLPEIRKDIQKVGKGVSTANQSLEVLRFMQAETLELIKGISDDSTSAVSAKKGAGYKEEVNLKFIFLRREETEEPFLYREYIEGQQDYPSGLLKRFRRTQNNTTLKLHQMYARQLTWYGKNDERLLEMVFVPSGSFQRGDSDPTVSRCEKPTHFVTIDRPFYIGKYPITQSQWEMVSGSCSDDILPSAPSYFKSAHRPVERVSWNEARRFCEILSDLTGQYFRLPYEAEWEYACRAGTATPSPYGLSQDSTHSVYKESRAEEQHHSHNVYRHEYTGKVFTPNKFGVYHMLGNVEEWCFDHWHGDYHGAPRDGSAWIDEEDNNRRVIRGGSYKVSRNELRASVRAGWEASRISPCTGFRVVMENERN